MPIRTDSNVKDARLHVKFTYSYNAINDLMKVASGKIAQPGGRKLSGGAATSSVNALNTGKARAEADLEYTAKLMARWSQASFWKVGKRDIPVKAIRQGTGWKLAVDGGAEAQKWARILESGYASQSMEAFIRGASKKRALKIRKKGDIPGFYMIIPKVHGKVSQNDNGKLIFKPSRDDRLGVRIPDVKILERFTARPAETEAVATFTENDASLYGVDELKTTRNTGEYTTAGGELVTSRDEDGRKVVGAKDVREQAEDNFHWEIIRMSQSLRRAGILVNEPAPRPNKPNATTERYYKSNRGGRPQRLIMPVLPEQYANRKEARVIASANRRVDPNTNRVVRTDVNNLRFVPLDASLQLPDDNPAQQTLANRRGDVLSFITLSTRKPPANRPGRPGHHIMQKAGRYMEERVQQLIAREEGERKQGFNRDGYTELLRSALGRSL